MDVRAACLVPSAPERAGERRIRGGGRSLAAFVVSCQTQGSQLSRTVDEALAPLGLPVLRARTTQRVAYEEAGGSGLSVFDLDGAEKAASEITALADELLALAGIAPPAPPPRAAGPAPA